MKLFLTPLACLVCLSLLSCTHSQVGHNGEPPVSTGPKPGLDRLGGHLVAQLELDYNSPYRIEVEIRTPKPEDGEHYLLLGETLDRQIKEALGRSMIFQTQNGGNAEFFLKPEYKSGKNTTILHLTLMHKQNRSVAAVSRMIVYNHCLPPDLFKPAIRSPEDLTRIAGKILVERFNSGAARDDAPVTLFIDPRGVKAHSCQLSPSLSKRLTMGFNTILSDGVPGISLVGTRQEASLILTGDIMRNDKGIIVHTRLKQIKASGRILSSFSGIIQEAFVKSEWFETDPSDENRRLLPGGYPPVPEPFKLDLSTGKGRTGLFFKKGEAVTIHAGSSRRAFIKIFNVAADGTMIRIYPNAFTSPAPVMMPGQIYTIPADHYDADFEIEVKEPLGEELIVALASNSPLPDFPAYTKTGYFGVRILDAEFSEMKKWANAAAVKYGAQISWNVLPFRTGRGNHE
ncbi:DUF4384 domain-containing protein [Desulfobacter latus]|uniref:DUF4384 domain-containing protein n=1 Tax=Desulfobacter latus TaxID=2292 RepID=A0A850TE56_9BACT|nr:DUF4384 domain-containing protein [Desulfobacter latus]NWH06577.1 DUF4384 domain-containing protein [Desulfobacter latus]